MLIDADIWGPKYWFFLHTAVMNYPDTPNEVTKRKYYDLISNMPLFIPDPKSSKSFVALLDMYPITSYLESKASLTRWTHFIHNKINRKLGKREPTYEQFMSDYYEKYYVTQKSPCALKQNTKKRDCILLIILVSFVAILLCNKNILTRYMYRKE